MKSISLYVLICAISNTPVTVTQAEMIVQEWRSWHSAPYLSLCSSISTSWTLWLYCLRSRPVTPNIVSSTVRVNVETSDQVTDWPSDQMSEWSNDQMTGWQDDRKLRIRLTVWYILKIDCEMTDIIELLWNFNTWETAKSLSGHKSGPGP